MKKRKAKRADSERKGKGGSGRSAGADAPRPARAGEPVVLHPATELSLADVTKTAKYTPKPAKHPYKDKPKQGGSHPAPLV